MSSRVIELSSASFLESRLRKEDIAGLREDLLKQFPLSKERRTFQKRIRRKGCPKNQTLSNTKKRELGLYNIERDGLLYKDMMPLHEMWKNYMKRYLDLPHFEDVVCVSSFQLTQNVEIGQLLYKADYHGAFISVVRSRAPSLVGIGGILVFETKNTLKLLGPDNITRSVPKYACEFEICIGNLKLGYLGKNFLIKPPERSTKKLRGSKEFQL